MLKFHCDICGHSIPRDETSQINLISEAYVPNKQDRKEDKGEACSVCSGLLRKLLHHSEDRELVIANLLTRISESGEFSDLLKDGAVSEKAKNPMGEGRCITVARIRAGMKQWQLGEKCFTEQAVVSAWETGKAKPDWEQLELILPELAEIRKEGCSAFCNNARCLTVGECYYGRYRADNGSISHGGR